MRSPVVWMNAQGANMGLAPLRMAWHMCIVRLKTGLREGQRPVFLDYFFLENFLILLLRDFKILEWGPSAPLGVPNFQYKHS